MGGTDVYRRFLLALCPYCRQDKGEPTTPCFGQERPAEGLTAQAVPRSIGRAIQISHTSLSLAQMLQERCKTFIKIQILAVKIYGF